MVFSSATVEQIGEAKRLLLESNIKIASHEEFQTFADRVCGEALGEKLKLGRGGIIRARTQDEIFRVLFLHMQQLREGNMTGAGNAGKMVFGTQGIGKTNAALAFVKLAEAVWEDVYAVYVDLTAVTNSVLDEKGFISAVIDYLRATRSFIFKAKEVDKYEMAEAPLCTALAKQKKRLFLFVDELDQLYKLSSRRYVGILGQLARLGSTGERWIGTIICGSSAFLPDLIEVNVTAKLSRRYFHFSS